MTVAIMVQGAAVAQGNADHGLLGRRSRLADGLGNFAGLAVAEARTTLAVADHDQSRKAEALAALHGLGNAVDVDQLLDQLLAAVIVTAATAIVTTAAATVATAAVVTATAATTAATIAAAATAARRTPEVLLRRLLRRSTGIGGLGRRRSVGVAGLGLGYSLISHH
jgi:hypothetical protein